MDITNDIAGTHIDLNLNVIKVTYGRGIHYLDVKLTL